MKAWLNDPRTMLVFHGWATVGWGVLAVVTTILALWFQDHPVFVAWIVFMSAYANAASHWSARQAAEAELDGAHDDT